MDFLLLETENILLIKDVEEMFNGLNCPQLISKPKLFILQSCRGGTYFVSFDDKWFEILCI